MANKQRLAIGLLMCTLAIVTVIILGSAVKRTCELREQALQRQVLEYIRELPDQRFDFVLAAQQLGTNYWRLNEQLMQLERSGRIKCNPRYLARKPIVISLDDMIWYYHRVAIVDAQ